MNFFQPTIFMVSAVTKNNAHLSSNPKLRLLIKILYEYLREIEFDKPPQIHSWKRSSKNETQQWWEKESNPL